MGKLPKGDVEKYLSLTREERATHRLCFHRHVGIHSFISSPPQPLCAMKIAFSASQLKQNKTQMNISWS